MIHSAIKYFKILSSIPRESKNEGGVADFLESFAKEHNLIFHRDSFNNVFIKKVNHNRKPIILQSHVDMVCVKDPDYDFDFKTMPLKLIEKDDYLSAYKTSLGADNGIGVSIILSFLASDNDYNIEALFTTDEEMTMLGATNFDYSLLKSDKLICLDGFSSKQLLIGCASCVDINFKFEAKYQLNEINGFSVTISGLKGGHSGDEIHKNIGNANNILLEILSKLNDVKLSTFNGGDQYNFITNFANATFASSNFEELCSDITNDYKKEFESIQISCKKIKISKIVSNEFSSLFIDSLKRIKTGVLAFDEDKNIIISQNLACVDLEGGLIKMSVRSHDENREEEQIKFLKCLADLNDFKFEILDRQSCLNQDKNSEFINELCRINEEVNCEKFQVINKHICFEGSIFKEKKNDLEIVVFSPDIYDVHSTKERVYIPSINKTCKLLDEFLKRQ